MTYEELRGVFERTNTVPIVGCYSREYPKVCLNTALTIEDQNIKDVRSCVRVRSQKFWSFEAGWEGYDRENFNQEEYDMGAKLRQELNPEIY